MGKEVKQLTREESVTNIQDVKEERIGIM